MTMNETNPGDRFSIANRDGIAPSNYIAVKLESDLRGVNVVMPYGYRPAVNLKSGKLRMVNVDTKIVGGIMT